MAKIYIKPYGRYTVSGSDFQTVESTSMRRIVLSPDNVHSVSIEPLENGYLCIVNTNRIPIDFTVSRVGKVMATVKFPGVSSKLLINTNWRLNLDGVQNRTISKTPDLYRCKKLNIDFSNIGLSRFDLKIEETGYATCVFSKNELLFVSMDGDRVMTFIQEFIETEAARLVGTYPGLQRKVAVNWIKRLVKNGKWLSS